MTPDTNTDAREPYEKLSDDEIARRLLGLEHDEHFMREIGDAGDIGEDLRCALRELQEIRPKARAADQLEAALLHLFREAEHDHQRRGMLMSLREILGYGHNLPGDGYDINIIESVRELLAAPAHATERDEA